MLEKKTSISHAEWSLLLLFLSPAHSARAAGTLLPWSAHACCWQKRLLWSWWKRASSPAGALTCTWLQQSNIKVRLCGAQGWAQLSWWHDGSTSRDQEPVHVSTAALIAGSRRVGIAELPAHPGAEVYFGLKSALWINLFLV